MIYGDAYSWEYVDKLHNMIARHIGKPINLHVYTESSRHVPEPYIKHGLIDWNLRGSKRLWWYKMQLFNPEHFAGPLLYFDLDVVITKNINWIWQTSNLRHFWAVRDFKYLWRPASYELNSSVMFWDTRAFAHVWNDFKEKTLSDLVKKYRGDQDYITAVIPQEQRRCFNIENVKSWRWELLDGGYNFERRVYNKPRTGTKIPDSCGILIFHGSPNPHEIQDPLILQHWQ